MKRRKGTLTSEEIRQGRLIDDWFFKYCCRDRIVALVVVQTILRILFDDPGLTLDSVTLNYELAAKEGVVFYLDVLTVDKNGRIYSLEIQRNDEGAGFARAKHLAYAVAVLFLEPTGEFKKRTGRRAAQRFRRAFPVYEIFLTEHDRYKGHGPVVQFNNDGRIEEPRSGLTAARPDPEAGTVAVVYVNCNHPGNDKVADLAHDMQCYNWEDMRIVELRAAVRGSKDPAAWKEVRNQMTVFYATELREADKKMEEADRKVKQAHKEVQEAHKETRQAQQKAEDLLAVMRIMAEQGISARQAVENAGLPKSRQKDLLRQLEA